MNRRLPLSIALAATLACATSATAHADPSQSASPPKNPGTGWAVALVSVVIGGSLTGLSLTIDCGRENLECARWASLGIWGGVGVASIGAVVGLLMVRAATLPPRVQVSFSVDRNAPHATLGYAF